MTRALGSIERDALLLLDLQNDFLHPRGAYARGGATAPEIAALPSRLAPLVDIFRARGGLIVATLFTLVPGRGGEPIVSAHLKQTRPFLGRGDFAPGSWGQKLVDELSPADISVEKIAYSAFYMTRLEWALRKTGVERLIVGGIVTNGGVASTVRDVHTRDFETILLSDGCAAFSHDLHETSLAALAPVARISRVAEIIDELRA